LLRLLLPLNNRVWSSFTSSTVPPEGSSIFETSKDLTLPFNR